MAKPNLCLVVACQVNRAFICAQTSSVPTGWLVSGSYVHAFGLPAFLFKNIGTVFAAPVYRNVEWYQSRLRRMGPPKAGLMSQIFLSALGVPRPLSRRSCVKLSDCIELFAYAI